MRSLLVKALYTAATRGPIAWAANWNDRASLAYMNEVFDVQPMTLRDVLPWASAVKVANDDR